MLRRIAILLLLAVVCPISVFAQANGKLQIHYMDVGQGDAAVLISPLGEVVLFDDGVLNQCGKPVSYLHSLGVTKIDYHIASHYHSDHIGCAPNILGMFPLQKVAFDRGGTYTTATYTAYVTAVGAKRQTAQKGQTITLDAGSANPVTITFVALNGNGVSTADENDLSLVAVVRFGTFDAEFGGDLSGAGTGVIDPDPATPGACSYTASPTSASATTAAGTVSVSVTTTFNCSWTSTSSAPWMGVTTGLSAIGTGTATLSYQANTGAARSGTATVAGKTITVSQAGVSTPTPAPTPTPSPGGIPTCARPAGAPSSATAVCKNGQFSSSQNRQGTCSSNGGVSCWICPGALCSGLTLSDSLHTAVEGGAVADIESSVAALVGPIEVYKVHHHGSKTSSNAGWLATTTPKVGIVSASNGNSYGHPTAEVMARLHAAGVRTYWTSVGNGAPASALDAVSSSGSVIVEVSPGSATFGVRYNATTDTYNVWGTTPLPAGAPFGSFDTPAAGSTLTGEVGITGWALDNSGVMAVDIYRSGLPGEPLQANGLVSLGTATLVAGARPDIAGAYATHPGAGSAGWGYMLLSNMLPNQGNGMFTISAYVRTVDGANTLLGSRTVSFANATNTRPFGSIDTPGQGQTVSGTVINFGWALTPNPNSIRLDGSTIDVYVDNVMVGHPIYNNFRSDIASLFPGYANTNGAVGYFSLDTTTLTNGVHTIAWVVRDNAGNASGIGSRYFTVANSRAGLVER